MEVITLKNITKSFRLEHDETSLKNRFEEFYALKNITFSLKKGEALGIIGENGSGKTTLLKIIAGILKPTSGAIDVKGKIMPFIELGAGIQPELTGMENIFLYGTLLGLPRIEIERKIDSIIEFSGLKKFIYAKLRTYSAGMQMRLVFSTAMMNNPDVLLIDEIIAVGDESFQKKSFNKIKNLKSQGKTIVFVSHSMEQIRAVCDKAIFLKDGKIKSNGLPDNVIHTYLETVYKRDNNSVFNSFDKKIKEISRLEKGQKKIIDSISKIQKNIFNKFKIKTLKNTLERSKWGISELKSGLSDLFENYKYILETNLESVEQKLSSAYNKNDNKLIKKLENKRYEILEDFKKLLLIKTKFCDKTEENKINQHVKFILNEQSDILKGTKREINVLNEFKELLEKEINQTKNQKIKEKLLKEFETVIMRISLLDKENKYGKKKTTRSFRRKILDNRQTLDNEKLEGIILVLRRVILDINDGIFNLQLKKKNYLITKNKKKLLECKKEIIKLKQKRKKLIDEMNRKQEIIGVQRKNLNVKIISARFLNFKNNETKRFKPGDKFTIEITYNALKRINNPVFGIGIFKDDGTHITGPNTKFHNFKIDSIKGKGRVYYTIDSLPLLEGTYLVTIAIHPYNSFIPYDVHTKLYTFKVIKNHVQDFGTFYINAKWKIEQN